MPREIPFGSEQHRQLVSLVRSMVDLSDNELGNKTREWRNAEATNVSYIPAADVERRAKVRRTEDNPDFTQIYVPYSYTMQMAAHTYMCNVFLGRTPVFQFQGSNGQGQDNVIAAEAIVDYQMRNGDMMAKQYFWFFDILQYGVGIQGIFWDEEFQFITEFEEEVVANDGITVLDPDEEPETEEIEVVREIEGYKGQKSFNVRPKDFICDPRVSWAQFQDGEFCGRRVRVQWSTILHGERLGIYFNIDALKDNETSSKQNDLEGDNPALDETSNTQITRPGRQRNFVNLIELYVRLIPSQYGIGKNTNPEIWVLTLANRNVIIGAKPSGWYHGMYPFIVQPMEFDAYGLTSRGFPEIGLPLEQTFNWLINSHMFNVDKAVNNEFLYDPTAIVTKDFLDPAPGKRIRIRPSAYGKDVRQFIHQFQQVDITRTNLQDIRVVELLYQKMFGISDQMLGGLAPTGRRTATEVRSAAGFGLNRLKIMSEYFSNNGFLQMGRMLLANSQQMYTAPMQLRIAGDVGATGVQKLEWTPQDIAGEFDLVPVDGTLPLDRFAMTALWKEILVALQSMPAIAGRYDVASIFSWVAKLGGLKNIDSFEITPMNQEKIDREVQRGNLVQSSEAGNAGLGRTVGAVGGEGGTVEGATRINGLGSTG